LDLTDWAGERLRLPADLADPLGLTLLEREGDSRLIKSFSSSLISSRTKVD